MLILALESSGETASAAVVTEGKVLAEINVAGRKTHSETLMPAVEFILRAAGTALADMDFIAAGAGPGSFTGLRIGIAAAKGICHGAGKMLIPVPTLDALAANASGYKIAVPVMDARRSQVYSCVYENADGHINKLTQYMAEDLDAVLKMAAELGGGNEIIFTGDATNVFYDKIVNHSRHFHIAPEHLRLQRAASVGLLALKRTGEAVNYDANPVIYLRKPQAERMKEEESGNGASKPRL